MTVADRFGRFIENIQLTASQHEDATTKAAGVMAALGRAYNIGSSSGYVIGSYGKRLAVRPPRDVDVLFPLPNSVLFRINSLSGNKQSRLLQEVRTVLAECYPRTQMRADGQVVVVPFSTFSVEVVPAFEFDTVKYLICDTNEGGSWKTTEPWAEFTNLDRSDAASNGNTRRLTQILKVWQRECNVPLRSIELELLAIDFLSGWGHASNSLMWADWMVRDFFGFLLTRTNTFVYMPGTRESLFLWDDWKSRAQSAYDRTSRACDYEGVSLLTSLIH